MPPDGKLLYKMMTIENLLRSIIGAYLHFNRVDRYKDFPDADQQFLRSQITLLLIIAINLRQNLCVLFLDEEYKLHFGTRMQTAARKEGVHRLIFPRCDLR
jgi:hypothetical protein